MVALWQLASAVVRPAPVDSTPRRSDSSGVQPQARYWTPLRTQIRAWLCRTSLPLAELYQGAVILLHEGSLPGRVSFISHAVREICNRLPDEVGVKKLPYFDGINRLDEVAVLWFAVGPPAADLSVSSPTPPLAIPDSPPKVLIDRRLAIAVGALLSDHRAVRSRPEERAEEMFMAIAPENKHAQEVLQPTVAQWLSVRKFFVAKTHVSKRVDADWSPNEIRDRFELFESTLAALIPGRFYGAMNDLDEILDDTNA